MWRYWMKKSLASNYKEIIDEQDRQLFTLKSSNAALEDKLLEAYKQISSLQRHLSTRGDQ